MREYVITLWKHEDLESFYEDMETEGGTLYIPNRAVELVNRRAISRNTHYNLTDEEAELIRQDPRVRGVDRVDMLPKPEMTYTETRTFTNNYFGNRAGTNYGVYEHTRDVIDPDLGTKSTLNNWQATVDVYGSGKNVDVLIVDGGFFNVNNPEYAVNANGTGGSRCVQHNWYENQYVSPGVTWASLGLVFNYPDSENISGIETHSSHVAGIVAGNSTGWAKDANIYHTSFGFNNVWDTIRDWHSKKPVNSATGRKNPTIANCSYGNFITMGAGQTFRLPTSITHNGQTITRETDVDGNGIWTDSELFERKIMKVYGVSRWKTQFHTVSATADIEDAIADGIIVVAAAGNDNSYIARDSDSDWDNKMTVSAPAFNYTASIYYNRPAGPSAPKKSIVVGSLAFDRYQKAEYSQFGPRIDLFACGSAISSVDNKYQMGYYTMIDPTRNDSEYGWEMNQGTSMAAPQVCGMMACVLESVPSLTADEAKQMLVQWSRKNQMQGNNTVWSKTSYEQLGNFYGSDFVGSPNRIARQPYLKQKTGNTAMPYKLRSTTGLAYPRSRVRRRG